MDHGHLVISAASSRAGQGIAELVIVVVFAVVCVAALVVGIVVSRRGTGRPLAWFGLAAGAFIVGALAIAFV